MLRGLMAGVVFAATFASSAAVAQPPMSAQDFVSAAAQSDQFEIQAGRVAAVQAIDPRVRSFAQQMVDEHTRTSRTLEEAAAASGLPPPPKSVGGDQQRMLNALQSLKGAEFTRTYVKQQVMAHTQALVVEQGYAASGADPNLRQVAQSAVPLIQHHLEMARQLRSAVGGS